MAGKNSQTTGDDGWVIACENSSAGRKSPRYFLVAATGPAQALALVQDMLGRDAALSVRGPAPAAHLARRNMKLGDIQEIVGRQQAFP